VVSPLPFFSFLLAVVFLHRRCSAEPLFWQKSKLFSPTEMFLSFLLPFFFPASVSLSCRGRFFSRPALFSPPWAWEEPVFPPLYFAVTASIGLAGIEGQPFPAIGSSLSSVFLNRKDPFFFFADKGLFFFSTRLPPL